MLMVSEFQRPLWKHFSLSGNSWWCVAITHLSLKHGSPHYPCLYVLKQPLVPGNTLSSCTWQFLVAINHVTNLTLSFPSQSFQGPNSPLSVWVSMLTFRKTTDTRLIKPFLYIHANFNIDFLLKAPKYFKDFFSFFFFLQDSASSLYFLSASKFFLNICCTKSVLLTEPLLFQIV